MTTDKLREEIGLQVEINDKWTDDYVLALENKCIKLTELLEAINYTHSCTELKGKKAISFEVYQDTFYGKLYNGKYQSKLDKNKIVTHNDIVKEYEGDTIN